MHLHYALQKMRDMSIDQRLIDAFEAAYLIEISSEDTLEPEWQIAAAIETAVTDVLKRYE